MHADAVAVSAVRIYHKASFKVEPIVHYLASKYLVYYDETFWNFGHHINLSKKKGPAPYKFYGRRRAAVASPRREGEPRNSVIRRAGRRPRGY